MTRLQWVLHTDERLLAVLWGSLHGAVWWPDPGLLVFTDRRMLLLRRDAFLAHAQVEHSLPWHEVGELSLSGRPGYYGGHDIATKLNGQDLYLQATSASSAEDLTRLTTLLRGIRVECIGSASDACT